MDDIQPYEIFGRVFFKKKDWDYITVELKKYKRILGEHEEFYKDPNRVNVSLLRSKLSYCRRNGIAVESIMGNNEFVNNLRNIFIDNGKIIVNNSKGELLFDGVPVVPDQKIIGWFIMRK